MSGLSVNGFPVLSGTVIRPRTGCWHAELDLDAEAKDTAALSGKLTLVWEGGPSWPAVAVPRRSGDVAGRYRLRLAGCGPGLGKDVPGRSYLKPTAGLVLSDIAKVAGLVVSPTVAPALLARQLPAWTRDAGPASTQLVQLARYLGVGWRILPTGTLWLGAEAWPAAPALPDAVRIDFDPAQAWTHLGTDQGFLLAPGQTYEGQRVECVEHRLAPSSVTAFLWLA